MKLYESVLFLVLGAMAVGIVVLDKDGIKQPKQSVIPMATDAMSMDEAFDIEKRSCEHNSRDDDRSYPVYQVTRDKRK